MPAHGVTERVEHGGGGDPEVGSDRQGVTGVIVEPGQDLPVDAGGQPVVGEVGLPHFVGLLGLEADVGRTGPLLRRRHDETLSAQGAIDRCSRHPEVVVLLEMPANRVRSGIEPLSDELTAQPDDQLDDRVGDRRWR